MVRIFILPHRTLIIYCEHAYYTFYKFSFLLSDNIQTKKEPPRNFLRTMEHEDDIITGLDA